MVFWDASALAKAYAQEQGTPSVQGALKASHGRGFVTDHVAIEVLTALGKHFRSNRLSRSGYRSAVAEFFDDYPAAFNLLDVDATIRSRALSLAQTLRGVSVGGVDLLHLASALHVQSVSRPHLVVFASSDAPLLNAARSHGLATFNPEVDPLGNLVAALH